MLFIKIKFYDKTKKYFTNFTTYLLALFLAFYLTSKKKILHSELRKSVIFRDIILSNGNKKILNFRMNSGKSQKCFTTRYAV